MGDSQSARFPSTLRRGFAGTDGIPLMSVACRLEFTQDQASYLRMLGSGLTLVEVPFVPETAVG